MTEQTNCSTCNYRDEWGTFPFVEPCPLSNFNLLNPHDILFIVEQIGCASHSSCPAPSLERWDNRLIWSLEDLLMWIRVNHPDQMDIRNHIDLMLGKYRDELKSFNHNGGGEQ